MKRNQVVMWIVGIFVFVSVHTGWTQESEGKQDDQKKEMSQLSLDVRDRVKPEGMDKHIQMIKEMKSHFTEHRLSSPCMVYLGDEFDVMHIVPIDSMAGLDQAHKEFERLSNAVGKEKWQKMMEEMGSTTEYSEMSISAQRPDLSYWANESDQKMDPQKAGHAIVEIYYLKPGMEMKGEEIGRKMAEMQKEKKSPVSCQVRQILIGPETPCYIAIFVGDDRASLHSKMQERERTLGEDFSQLMNEARSALRRVERREYHHDPALSYFPQESSQGINADASEPAK